MNDQDVSITVSAKDEASKKLQEVRKNVDSVGDVGESVRDKLGKASLAIAAIGAGLTAYSKSAVDSTVDYVKGVNMLSRQTGMAVDTTSRLVYAMGRSGISAQEASSSLGIFSKRIVEANEKSGEAALKQADLKNKMEVTTAKIKELTTEVQKNGDKSGDLGRKIQGLNIDLQTYKAALSEASSPLAKLGVATQDATGKTRPFNDILLDVADKFKAMPDSAEKAKISMDLFGRSGKALIPVLNQGRDGIEELGRQADKLGLTITTKNVAAVAAYTKANKDLKDSQQALSLAVGTEALPMWQKLSEATNAAVSSILKLPQPFKGAATAILAFGGPVATAVATIAGFGANMGTMAQTVPGVGKALTMLAGSFGSLGSLLMGWPLIILAIVAATALLLQHFGLLKPMIDFVRVAAMEFWNALVAALAPAIENIRNQLAQLAPLMPYVWELLKYLAIVIGVIVVGAIVVLIAAATGLAYILVQVFNAIVTAAVWLKDTLTGAFNFIRAVFTGNMDGITSKGASAVANLLAIFGPIGMIASIFMRAFSAVLGVMGGSMNSAINMVRGFIGAFHSAGAALINAFGDGVSSAFGRAKDVVKNGLAAVRKLLPFSDAKEGPLSDLTLSGRRFSETIAKGMEKGAPAMRDAASNALSGLDVGAVSPVISPIVSPTSGVGTGADGGRRPVNIGTVILQDESAVQRFFRELDNDTILGGKGLTPVRGGAL